VKTPSLLSLLGPIALAVLGASACSGSSSVSYTTAAEVSGSADTHCMLQDAATPYLLIQPTSQSDCQFRPDAATVDSNVDADDTPDYGDTMYNDNGRDDDCKYFVQWKSTEIDENNNVFFLTTAQVNAVTPSAPVIGANILAEVFLSDTHPAPPTNQTAVESPPGTYKVGPIQFDEAGMWTVRFHLFENCLDYADGSPHGHAAFYVNVK
jgi:hypothetical protein